MRGAGESERLVVDGSDPQLERFGIEALLADLEAIRQHLGLERMSIIGQSFGGSLALLYANRYPQRVDKIIMLSGFLCNLKQRDMRRDGFVARLSQDLRTHLVKGLQALAQNEASWNQDRLDFELHQTLSPTVVANHCPQHQERARTICRSGPWKHERWNRIGYWAFKGVKDFEEDIDVDAEVAALAKLQCPALLNWGVYDFVPWETALATRQALSGSQLVVYENSGHVISLDETELLLQTIRAFLKGEALPKPPYEGITDPSAG
jgi:proline iminopeptidase